MDQTNADTEDNVMEGFESRQEIDALLKEAEEDMLINSSTDDISNSEEDDDYVQMLIEREINNGFPWHICEFACLALDNWLKYARWNAISWILRREQHYVIQLLSLACLSLATKMKEEKTLTLRDFPMEEYQFDNKVIQRMELLIPLHQTKQSLELRNLFLATMKDVNLMGNRPSIIAVAATLVAMDPKLTKSSLDLKIKAFSPIGFLEINDVFPCYTRIQELDMPAIGNGSINKHF
ncbi:cyclin-D3-1-like [Diospyros lotus]|uniref:cyclin-D3-1-like n=1 Tax=Diospyros lotus TaxID=55363 RepID=UPI002259CB79|nr:cyclin-D3-1-like [Diospyros lotus]